MAGVSEGEFRITIDKHSPHSSKGIQVKWKKNDILRFSVKATLKDVSGFGYLSVRIAKTVTPPPNGDLSELRIGLKDNVNTKYILVKDKYTIPGPFVRKDLEVVIPTVDGLHFSPRVFDKAEHTKVAFDDDTNSPE